jgi:hypothetical protein
MFWLDPNPNPKKKFGFGYGFGFRHCFRMKIFVKIKNQTLEREKSYVFLLKIFFSSDVQNTYESN